MAQRGSDWTTLGLKYLKSTQRVHVTVQYVPEAQRGAQITTLGLKYFLFICMDSLGYKKKAQENAAASLWLVLKAAAATTAPVTSQILGCSNNVYTYPEGPLQNDHVLCNDFTMSRYLHVGEYVIIMLGFGV